jgi:hypothetical protein
MKTLLMPYEVYRIFRYPAGKSERLAKRGKIPHIRLPDGQIRFKRNQIEKIAGGDDRPPANPGESRANYPFYLYQQSHLGHLCGIHEK